MENRNFTNLWQFPFNATAVPPNTIRAPWWIMVVLAIIISITMAANLLVIASFLSEPRLRIPFNYYLLNLAISDLVVGVMGMPYYAIYTYYNYWPLSYAHCSFWMFFDYLGTADSLWGVVAVSLDRVWAVTFPFSYRVHNFNQKCLIGIVLCRLVSLGALLPGYIGTRSNYVANSNPYVCDWNSERLPKWNSAVYVLALGEWIPVLITVVSYVITTTKIFQKLLERRKTVDVSVPIPVARRLRTRVRDRLDRQAFLLLTLLVAAVLTLWTPWLVYSIGSLVFHVENELFYIVSYWVAYSMSAVNPFLFNATSDEMRNTLKRLLATRFL